MATPYKLPTANEADSASIRAAMDHDLDRLVGAYRSFVTACGAAYPSAFQSVNLTLGKGKQELDVSNALARKMINFAIGGVMTLALGPVAGPLARWAVRASTDAGENGANAKFVNGLAKKGSGLVASPLTKLLVPPTDLRPFNVGEAPVDFLAKLLNAVTNFEQTIRNKFGDEDDTTNVMPPREMKQSFVKIQGRWPAIPTAPNGTETWTADQLVNPLRRSLWLTWILSRDRAYWFERGNTLYVGHTVLPWYREGNVPLQFFDECKLSSADSDEWLFRHCVPALSELGLPGRFYRLNVRWVTRKQVPGTYLGTWETQTSVSEVDETHGLNLPNLLLWAQPQLGWADAWLATDMTSINKTMKVAELLRGALRTTT